MGGHGGLASLDEGGFCQAEGAAQHARLQGIVCFDKVGTFGLA